MKIIHIPIEVKSRELVPKIFFISRALKKNFACFVGDKIAVNRSVKFFKSGIYFHKSINRNDKNYIIDIQSKVDGYISIDEEAGNSFKNEKELENLLEYRSSKINVMNVDKIYNWGNFDNKVWVKKYKKFKKKFKITGLPRIDIWKKSISKLIFDKEIDYLKKRYGDFIFIPSTFISSKDKLNQLINFEKKRIFNKEYLQKKIDSRKFEYELFLEFKELISRLSKENLNLNIVIKPHPSELIADWKIVTKNLNNVFVDNKYEITPYIMASKCVVFNSSTAGMQSVFMGKKTICYKSISDKKSLRNFPNKFGIQCKSYNKLKKKINEDVKVNNKDQIKILKQRMFISKKFSSDLILQDIKVSFNKLGKLKYKKISFMLFSIAYNIKSFLKIEKIQRLFSKKKDVNLPSRSMSQKLDGGISKKEIKLIFEKLKIKNCHIKNFGRNGYLIYK